MRCEETDLTCDELDFRRHSTHFSLHEEEVLHTCGPGRVLRMIAWLGLVLFAIVGNGASDRVILEFRSNKCPACEHLQPTVDRLVQEGWVIRPIDAAQDRAMTERWRIRQIPTLIVIEKGREVDRIVGSLPYEELLQRLEGSASSPSARDSQRLGSNAEPTADKRSIRQPKTDSAPTIDSLEPIRSSAIVRGQSPREQQRRDVLAVPNSRMENAARALASRDTEPLLQSDPQGATVRIRVNDPSGEAIGTGTIIDTHGEEALVLTCGHLFRDSKGQSPVTVELFHQGTVTPVAGAVVDFRADDVDIGLIAFRMPFQVSVAKLLPRMERLQEQLPVFSYGCDAGADPSRRDSHITKLNRYLGPSNVEVAIAPTQGRSGGGLFDASGYLIGVCFAADPENDEGLYSGPDVVYEQLNRLGLNRLYSAPRDLSVGNHQRNTSNVVESQTPAPDHSNQGMQVIAYIREPGRPEQVIHVSNASADLVDLLHQHSRR